MHSVLKRKRKLKRKEDIAADWIERSQDPPDFDVQEFPVKGRGVVTTVSRSKGDFLLVYKGEMLTEEEGERREAEGASGYRFFYSSKGKKLCIDATEESSLIGRLVNHGRKKDRNAVMKEIQDMRHHEDMEVCDNTLHGGDNQFQDEDMDNNRHTNKEKSTGNISDGSTYDISSMEENRPVKEPKRINVKGRSGL